MWGIWAGWANLIPKRRTQRIYFHFIVKCSIYYEFIDTYYRLSSISAFKNSEALTILSTPTPAIAWAMRLQAHFVCFWCFWCFCSFVCLSLPFLLSVLLWICTQKYEYGTRGRRRRIRRTIHLQDLCRSEVNVQCPISGYSDLTPAAERLEINRSQWYSREKEAHLQH